MKKHILRVKQLADQTFLRGEKSEELNYEELQRAERKIEFLKSALNAICKKLPYDVSSQENKEKRLKKFTEHQLATAFDQCARRVSDSQEPNGKAEDVCELFREILSECVDAENQLADEQDQHEQNVEKLVAKPLQELLDKEIPNILKLRKNLTKYVLDKDSATNRYNQAAKHGVQKENIKTEMEDADTKVEQIRDALAAEMFSVLRRENELSQYILQILKLQRAHHESALKSLEHIIPKLEQQIGDSKIKPIFGTSLEEHLRVTKRRIAFPLEVCICTLSEIGMSEEGLFRVAGSMTRVKRMKLSMDSGCFSCPLLPEYRDVHVIASTLKMYLRELPEPLLSSMLYTDWMNAMRVPDQRLECVKAVLQKLPQANRDNLTYLIQFLSKLSKHPETKMTSSNIAIVMAPNLLWQDRSNDDMTNCTVANMVVEYFINNVEKLFDKDVSSYLKLRSSDLLNGNIEEEEFSRPHVAATARIYQDRFDTESLHLETHSPKTQARKRKPAAPEPPRQSSEITEAVSLLNVRQESEFTPEKNRQINFDHQGVTYSSRFEEKHEDHRSYYPSGSGTLRPIRNKVVQNTNSDDEKTIKRRSLALEDQNVQKSEVQINLDEKTVDHKYVTSTNNIQVTSAKPVHHITAQSADVISAKPPIGDVRPVAAPRSIILDDKEGSNQFIKQESLMTRSLNSGLDDIDPSQLRRPREDEKPNKPAVPVRPASLRGATRSDDVQRTQCSVYNVPHKQQPSIVTIPNRSLGHDSQMAEKEKFLGHHSDKVQSAPRMSVENKYNDVNFNCDSRNRTGSGSKLELNKPDVHKPEIPIKPPHRKSNEMLNIDTPEKCNGNPKPSHHVRTRSDGNIVEQVSLLTTPSSPKALAKPTQPPPPPPITHKVKGDGDSTDL